MSLATFFQQAKQQMKSAVSAHPIEILMIVTFTVGIWFVDWNLEKDHLAYWLFESILFAVVYLSRPYAWYRFSWLVPLATILAIWQFNDSAEFYLTNPKFWGAQFIALLLLCGFPFVKNNQAFTYRNFTNLFHLALAIAVWGLIVGLVAAIEASIRALFNVNFSRSFDSHLYSSLVILCPPLFFLVFQQRQSNTEMTVHRIFEILVNIILAPALMIFTLLLYIYVGKIISVGVLPKGMVANIALPYLLSGLAIYALRSICAQTRWNLFFKYYPYLAIAPLVLLWLAIERRIGAYAWTEQRIYLVALAFAITIAYGILMLPKIRQYRLISGVVMSAVFAMTWLVNPQEIAYQSQNSRFQELLHKLDLADEQGKIRNDINLVDRLETMKADEREDWIELEHVTDYVVFNTISTNYSSTEWDKHREQLVQTYGEKIKDLNSMSIYEDEIRLNGEAIGTENNRYHKNFKQSAQPIDIENYRTLIHTTTHRFYQAEPDDTAKEPHHLCFLEEQDKYCIDINAHIKQRFQQHHVDNMQIQSDSVLQILKDDLLKIQGDDFVIYLSELGISFDPKTGYTYNFAFGDLILQK